MAPRTLAIGEILWDMLPEGAQPGGAPANFAYHAKVLGMASRVVTRVGADAMGHGLLDHLAAVGLSGDLVQVDDVLPTGMVTVALTGDGMPEFTIHEPAAWDHIELTDAALAAAREADAICFGSLAQRCEVSRESIHALLREARPHCLKVFDINLRQEFYTRETLEVSLQLANVLKLNDAELPVLADGMELKGNAVEQVAQLAARYGLAVVALTRGAQGSLIYQDGRCSTCAARPVVVADTVGAGDAFTAALVVGLLRRMDLDDLHDAASGLAAHVCSCKGATPVVPEVLRRRFGC